MITKVIKKIADKKNHLYQGEKYRWPNTLRGKRLTHLLTSREVSVTQTGELYNSSPKWVLRFVKRQSVELSY